MIKKIGFNSVLLILLLFSGCGEEYQSIKTKSPIADKPQPSIYIEPSVDFVLKSKTTNNQEEIAIKKKVNQSLTKEEELFAQNQELKNDNPEMQSNEENFAEEADEIDFNEEV